MWRCSIQHKRHSSILTAYQDDFFQLVESRDSDTFQGTLRGFFNLIESFWLVVEIKTLFWLVS
jgi:hypothetical protein